MTRPASATREKLIETARDLFHQQGYTPTGIAQILKKSGVNSGSLYYFFPTKEDLLIAVLEWYRDNIKSALLDQLTAHLDDPIEKVFGLLDGYRQMLLVFEYELGCPIGGLALELSNSHPAVRSLILVNFEQWVDAVESFLRGAEDRLPEETDLRSLAVHFLTAMEGGLMVARTYRSTTPFDNTVEHLRAYMEVLLAAGSNWSAPRQMKALEETL